MAAKLVSKDQSFADGRIAESDILGFLGDDKLAAILPYADPTAGMLAKSRFEGSLRYLEFIRMVMRLTLMRSVFGGWNRHSGSSEKVAGKQPI